MNFLLKVLAIFAAFIVMAAALPHGVTYLRESRMRSAAEKHILAQVRDPSSVKWNDKRFVNTPKVCLMTLDFTAVNGFGGPVREAWTFEFDADGRELRSVKKGEKAKLLKLAGK